MKVRLIKTWNNKPIGATGVFLEDFARQLIKDGIAEKLDDDFVVEVMPEKKKEQQEPIYIPVPVPMSYLEEDDAEELKDLSKPKK
jgi:hypothetical protein